MVDDPLPDKTALGVVASAKISVIWAGWISTAALP